MTRPQKKARRKNEFVALQYLRVVVSARANKPAASCLQGKQFFPGQTNQPLYVCRANGFFKGKQTSRFMFAGQTI
jgi:hypothetical protein